MTTEDLLARMDCFFGENLKLAGRKNADYAQVDDALENFRDFGFFGVVVRLNDKFKRLKNIVQKGGEREVEDETIEDTLRDICNYSAIAYVMRQQEK